MQHSTRIMPVQKLGPDKLQRHL